jgi:1-aminocyclopropane-1-carboxylate deaminase
MIAKNQPLYLPEFAQHGFSVHIKREDRLHPLASGNKWRKLKYNMEAFHSSTATAILTFGGAYSNHLAAVAAMANHKNILAIGIVRGDELAQKPLNPTLDKCQQNGMQLFFVSREEYALKEQSSTVQSLQQTHGEMYILPEGGTNALAVKGCEEILTPDDDIFDTVCCAVGTGGTLAGLALAAAPHQKVVGFQVVKDASIPVRIRTFVKRENWSLVQHATYRGYAQADAQLVAFATMFLRRTGVLLDPIYTAPLLFQLVQMIKENTWNFGKKILLIHTGGTQGIAGFNSRHGLQWPEG